MAVGMIRTIVVDCVDPEPLAAFWSAILDLPIHHTEDDWISLHPFGPGQPRIAFQRVPEAKVAKNRLHLDVWVPDIAAATEAAVALGATRLGFLVEESPEPFQVMADPAGNEFCLVHLAGSVGP
jgi:hypothetical protein